MSAYQSTQSNSGETLAIGLRSKDNFARAQLVFPDGTARVTIERDPTPRYMEHGVGSYLFDVDGRRFLDLNCNFTTLIHGHLFAPVIEAVTRQLQRGSCFADPTERARSISQHLDHNAFAHLETLGNTVREGIARTIGITLQLENLDFIGAGVGLPRSRYLAILSGFECFATTADAVALPAQGSGYQCFESDSQELTWNRPGRARRGHRAALASLLLCDALRVEPIWAAPKSRKRLWSFGQKWAMPNVP